MPNDTLWTGGTLDNLRREFGDVYGGPPESSGLVFANEVTLVKPKVDVLVAGEIVPRAASEAVKSDSIATLEAAWTAPVRWSGP